MWHLLPLQFLSIAIVCIQGGHQPDLSSKLLSIDSLKPGQNYHIKVESNGCFHHTELSLVISKTRKGFSARFKMIGNIEMDEIKEKYRTNRLTELQVDSIRNFEKKLILVSNSRHDCTTVDNYTLQLGEKEKSYTVDECMWQGIGGLVAYLFKE